MLKALLKPCMRVESYDVLLFVVEDVLKDHKKELISLDIVTRHIVLWSNVRQ